VKYWLAVLKIFGVSFNLFPEEIPKNKLIFSYPAGQDGRFSAVRPEPVKRAAFIAL
jgi:hypothetical protein